ncbi:Ribosomal protein S29 [Cryptosporidium meleagridis]
MIIPLSNRIHIYCIQNTIIISSVSLVKVSFLQTSISTILVQNSK